MADYCRQCSMTVLGAYFGDLSRYTTEADTKQNIFAEVLCERCGSTRVDHDGTCIGPCDKSHTAEA